VGDVGGLLGEGAVENGKGGGVELGGTALVWRRGGREGLEG